MYCVQCTRYTFTFFFSKNQVSLHPFSINHLKSKSDPARSWLHWKTQQILFTFFNRFPMHIVYRIQIDFIDKSVEYTYRVVRVSLFSVKQSQMSANSILKCCCYLNLSVMEFHSYTFIKYDLQYDYFYGAQHTPVDKTWICLIDESAVFFLPKAKIWFEFCLNSQPNVVDTANYNRYKN